MSSTNDVTGDKLVSKVGNTQAYEDNFDRIFRSSKELRKCDTAEHRKCDCPNWTLGCCGAGTKEKEE